MKYQIKFTPSHRLYSMVDEINKMAKEGWRIHTWMIDSYTLLERDLPREFPPIFIKSDPKN